jgi:HEAT repeat protein
MKGQAMTLYSAAFPAALVLVIGVVPLPAGSIFSAPTSADIAKAFAAMKTYDYGDSSTPLRVIDRLINETQGNPPLRLAIEREMVKILESDARLACKQEICRRLWIIGTDVSVPPLGRLLASGDPHLAEAACYALSKHSSPEVAKALHAALGKAKGRSLAAVVTLLGDRRDPECAGKLAVLAGSPDNALAEAAIVALGKMATLQAIQTLKELHAGKIPVRQTASAHALLQAGQELAARGDLPAARAVLEQLTLPTDPPQVRRGALLQRLRLGGRGSQICPGKVEKVGLLAGRQIAPNLAGTGRPLYLSFTYFFAVGPVRPSVWARFTS